MLVMTHDHAEDFALCDAALRCAHLASIGLIGSAAKWRRFEKGLRVEGHSEESIARIRCPIGDPSAPAGKDPAHDRARASPARCCGWPPPSAWPRMSGSFQGIVRARVLDTPDDPLTGGVLRSDDDVALRVVDGVIVERAAYAEVRAAHPDDDVLDLREGVLLPGLVDTHVHYPQVRAIGALGMPLLEWLDRCALPEEERLADPAYARAVAEEFVFGLVSAGHHHGAGLRLALRLGRRRALRRGRAGRPAGDVRARRQRPGPPGVAAHHARPFRRGVARARGALARPGPAAVRRHPALLVLHRRRSARRLRDRARGGGGLVVHLARQREPRRGGRGGRAVPRAGPLRRHL